MFYTKHKMPNIAGMIAGSVLLLANPAYADCGDVSITEMNWASSQIITEVAKFLMEQGYGCKVEKVPSATTTSVASLAENSEPDIVTELWLNSTGDVYAKLEAEGKVSRLAEVIAPGGVEGWWVPQYLADAHPELMTIEGVMANPDLVGGRFNNCPDGWGCRIVNDNLVKAFDLPAAGFEVFNHGSGETLATSIAAAYENREPWFGYYWGPTSVLGQYSMAKVALGKIDTETHSSNQNKNNPSPGVSDFPPAPVLTVATASLAAEKPDIAELMGKVSFDVELMSMLLAWQEEQGASAEEAAVYFLTNHSDMWSQWVNDSARDNLSALIN